MIHIEANLEQSDSLIFRNEHIDLKQTKSKQVLLAEKENESYQEFLGRPLKQENISNENVKEEKAQTEKTVVTPYKCVACGSFFSNQEIIQLHLLTIHRISVS